jgi:energy-coupling factor transport system permease protein
MTPLLVSRNPWVLLQVLVVVSIVRAVWRPAISGQDMGWFLRIAGSFVLVGVAFNVLTVHSGDQVIADLPSSLPVIGGPLTWNALVYGILGGVALFTLVLTGITMSALISWVDLFHVMPRRLAAIAVTGSVAWAFLPQTAVAWRQIREAQVMRGHTFHGVRDFIPIVVPLLAGGLDRSLIMAEALESRGFGSPASPAGRKPGAWHNSVFGAGVVIGLGGIMVAVYCLAVGLTAWAVISAAVGCCSLAVVIRQSPAPAPVITRYRPPTWRGSDSLVTICSIVTLAVTLLWNAVSPGSLAYAPYPSLTVPPVDPPLLLALGLLLSPALAFRPPARV